MSTDHVTRHQRVSLNLGGEGEVPECINQQPPWVDFDHIMSLRATPLRGLKDAQEPILFCDNNNLCFPDESIDIIYTNSVPIDNDTLWVPSVTTDEIERVLKFDGIWVHDGFEIDRGARDVS